MRQKRKDNNARWAVKAIADRRYLRNLARVVMCRYWRLGQLGQSHTIARIAVPANKRHILLFTPLVSPTKLLHATQARLNRQSLLFRARGGTSQPLTAVLGTYGDLCGAASQPCCFFSRRLTLPASCPSVQSLLLFKGRRYSFFARSTPPWSAKIDPGCGVSPLWFSKMAGGRLRSPNSPESQEHSPTTLRKRHRYTSMAWYVCGDSTEACCCLIMTDCRFSDECKRRKVKCNGQVPCQHCVRNHGACIYVSTRGSLAQRQEKYNFPILEDFFPIACINVFAETSRR